MRRFETLVLASLNQDKISEFADLFAKHSIKVKGPESFVRNASFLGSVEKHHESASYLENAKLKCHAMFMAAKVPTLADDSGLEVDALAGQPGVRSAVYASERRSGEDQSFANRRKLLEAMKGQQNRKARFRCVLAFMVEGVLLTAEGVVEGTIAAGQIGDKGFGYDSIFIPEGANGRTFAQLNEEEKNALSHRSRAIEGLMNQLRERQIDFVRP
jgi:XTP/dITP diphosphohydrolase